MTKQILSALKVSLLALLLSFGLSFVYAWTAPTVTAPNGNVSAPINTSSTAQTKAGAFTVGSLITAGSATVGSLNAGSGAISTTGSLTSGPATVGSLNAGSGSISTTGTLASGPATVTSLSAGSGSISTTGSLTSGSLTATGNIQGQHIKFPGVGGDSGVGADYYGIYQESGPWVSPYPDLRIQYHTGIKYDANQGYGGHQFYTGYDGSGNPAGLQMQITDKVYVTNDVCTTGGKCLSAAGGGIKATMNVGPTGVNDGGAGWDANCPAGYVMSGLRIIGNSMTVRCAQI